MFTCPVCYFENMPDPPMDYNICPCCGTEFGHDDEALSDAELRSQWLSNGARWFYMQPPTGWDPWRQLRGPPVLSPVQVQAFFPSSLATSTEQKELQKVTVLGTGLASSSQTTWVGRRHLLISRCTTAC